MIPKMKIPPTFLLMALLSFLYKPAQAMEVGDPAPTPPAIDQNGNPFDLAGLYQSGITLVYFYPKADTPGCTRQACSLRDAITDLGETGVQVVGVSRDTPEAQKRFQENHELPFPLIADREGTVSDAFGVGRILGFTNRTSFLVKDGKIAWIAPRAQTDGHAQEVMEAVAALRD